MRDEDLELDHGPRLDVGAEIVAKKDVDECQKGGDGERQHQVRLRCGRAGPAVREGFKSRFPNYNLTLICVLFDKKWNRGSIWSCEPLCKAYTTRWSINSFISGMPIN